MAATNLVVDPAELKTAANTINGLADKYKTTYTAIFQQFQQVDAAWDGTDNEEYNAKVCSFRHDFEAMSNYFESLKTYLNTAASNYEEAQNNVSAKAKTLKQ